jgi:hypothetical protein
MTKRAPVDWAAKYRDTLKWKVRVEGDRIYLDDLEVAMLRMNPILGPKIWLQDVGLHAVIWLASSTSPAYWLFPAVSEKSGQRDERHLSAAGGRWTVGCPWELPTTTGWLLAPARWWPWLPTANWRMPTRSGLGQLAERVAEQYLAEARPR